MIRPSGPLKLAAHKNNPSELGKSEKNFSTNDDWNKLNLKLEFIRMDNNLDSVSRKLVLLEGFIEQKFQEEFIKYLKDSGGESSNGEGKERLCEVSQSSSSLSAPEERVELGLGATYVCPRDEDLSVNSTATTLLSLTTNSSVLQNLTASSFNTTAGKCDTLCKETLTSLLSMEVDGETYVCPRDEELSVNSTMSTCLSLTAVSSVRGANESTDSIRNASGVEVPFCGRTETSTLSTRKEETYVCPRNEESSGSLTRMTFLSEPNGNSDSDMSDSDEESDEVSASGVSEVPSTGTPSCSTSTTKMTTKMAASDGFEGLTPRQFNDYLKMQPRKDGVFIVPDGLFTLDRYRDVRDPESTVKASVKQGARKKKSKNQYHTRNRYPKSLELQQKLTKEMQKASDVLIPFKITFDYPGLSRLDGFSTLSHFKRSTGILEYWDSRSLAKAHRPKKQYERIMQSLVTELKDTYGLPIKKSMRRIVSNKMPIKNGCSLFSLCVIKAVEEGRTFEFATDEEIFEKLRDVRKALLI